MEESRKSDGPPLQINVLYAQEAHTNSADQQVAVSQTVDQSQQQLRNSLMTASLDPAELSDLSLIDSYHSSHAASEENEAEDGVPVDIYARAIYEYAPPGPEAGLHLSENAVVYVSRQYENGWWEGECLDTGEVGYFPGNYVEVLPEDEQKQYRKQQREPTVVGTPLPAGAAPIIAAGLVTSSSGLTASSSQHASFMVNQNGEVASEEVVRAATAPNNVVVPSNMRAVEYEEYVKPRRKYSSMHAVQKCCCSPTSRYVDCCDPELWDIDWRESFDCGLMKEDCRHLEASDFDCRQWHLWTKRKKQRALVLMVAAPLLIFLIGLTAGLAARPSSSPKTQTQVLTESFSTLEASKFTDSETGSEMLVISPATIGNADISCLLSSIGLNTSAIPVGLLQLDPNATADFLLDFAEQSIASLGLASTPHQILTINMLVFGQKLNATLLLFVPPSQTGGDPVAQVAVRIVIPPLQPVLNVLSSLRTLGLGQGSWMDTLEWAANGGTVMVSTGDLSLDSGLQLIRPGVNFLFDLANSNAQGEGAFINKLGSVVDSVSSGSPKFSFNANIPLTCSTLPDGSQFAEVGSSAFVDISLKNAALRTPNVGISVTEITLSVSGLGRNKRPSISFLALFNVQVTGNSFDTTLAGHWDFFPPDTYNISHSDPGALDRYNAAYASYSSRLSVAGMINNVSFIPDLAKVIDLDTVSAACNITFTPSGVTLERLYFYAGATIVAFRNTRVSISGQVETSNFAILANADMGSHTLSSTICEVTKQCDPIPFVDELNVANLNLYASAASHVVTFGGQNLPHGFSVWATSTFDIPADVQNVLRIVGVTSRNATGTVGIVVPFIVPTDLNIYLGIKPSVSRVSIGNAMIQWEGVVLSVAPIGIPTMTLATSMSVYDLADEPLVFSVAASITAAASVVVEGSMQGVWTNVAGIKGFTVANAGVSIGATVVAITEVGFWGNFTFGAAMIDFTVLLSAARGKFAILASLSQVSAKNMIDFIGTAAGVDLGVAGDVVQALTQTNFETVNIKIAPFLVTINGNTIFPGFYIYAKAQILGADIEVDTGSFERDVAIPGVGTRTLTDFQIDFAFRRVSLVNLVPGLNFASFLITFIDSKISENTRLCVDPCFFPAPDCPVCASVDISGVLSKISNALNGLFVLDEFSLTNFSVVDIAMFPSTNMPLLTLGITVAGKSHTFSKRVDLSFIANQGNAVKDFVHNMWKDKVSTMVTDVIKDFCSDLNKLCLTLAGIKVCLGIPGVC